MKRVLRSRASAASAGTLTTRPAFPQILQGIAGWAWLPAFVYLALGIWMPSSPFLVLNREESLPALLRSLAVLGAAAAVWVAVSDRRRPRSA